MFYINNSDCRTRGGRAFTVVVLRRLSWIPKVYLIFVHASPRSGSTYFFNVLRRNKSLLCFNEAINNGFKGDQIGGKAGYRLYDMPRFHRQRVNLNHHFLDRADFEEFIEARDAVMHLFPRFQVFENYIPKHGLLQPELAAYLRGLMDYGLSQDKRPVLCEIYSRGRAGALRRMFGGFHIAGYRDPLSQFGSFIRQVIEQGSWFFLAFPVQELGICGEHPLYQVVAKQWRPPVLPWSAKDHATRWATDTYYLGTVASSQPGTLENAFRWHLFAWILSNLAAISYSDLVLDMDKLHEDPNYRAAVTDSLSSEIGTPPDLSDLAKFTRYYEFELFNVQTVCSQVVLTIKRALSDGRLERALSTIGTQRTIPTVSAVALLLEKIDDSLKLMATSTDRHRILTADWQEIARKNRRLWFNPAVRWAVQPIYPIAATAMQALRGVRNWVSEKGSRLSITQSREAATSHLPPRNGSEWSHTHHA